MRFYLGIILHTFTLKNTFTIQEIEINQYVVNLQFMVSVAFPFESLST